MSASLPLWSSPPEILELGCNEVHVWRAVLDLPISRVRSLEQTLAADERRRAERFTSRKTACTSSSLEGSLGQSWVATWPQIREHCDSATASMASRPCPELVAMPHCAST